MKKILIIFMVFLVSLLAFGCSNGDIGDEGRGQILVRWAFVPVDQSLASILIDKLKGFQNVVYADIITKMEYGYIYSPVDRRNADIIAEYYNAEGALVPDADFVFTMQDYTDYRVEMETNNRYIFEAQKPGEGVLKVEYGGETVLMPFVIYNAAAIGFDRYSQGFDFGYDFENSQNVVSGDLTFINDNTINAPYGYYITEKYETDEQIPLFWGKFTKNHDATQFTYQAGDFTPEWDKIYFIKTANGGYVKLIFSLYMSHPVWEFVFDYSADGQF